MPARFLRVGYQVINLNQVLSFEMYDDYIRIVYGVADSTGEGTGPVSERITGKEFHALREWLTARAPTIIGLVDL